MDKKAEDFDSFSLQAPLTDADTQVDIRKDPNQQDLPREEEEGLSGKEKAALGAGAGLAVGGLGAAALHLRSDEDEVCGCVNRKWKIG